MVSSSRDKEFMIWELTPGELNSGYARKSLSGHAEAVSCVVLSPATTARSSPGAATVPASSGSRWGSAGTPWKRHAQRLGELRDLLALRQVPLIVSAGWDKFEPTLLTELILVTEFPAGKVANRGSGGRALTSLT